MQRIWERSCAILTSLKICEEPTGHLPTVQDEGAPFCLVQWPKNSAGHYFWFAPEFTEDMEEDALAVLDLQFTPSSYGGNILSRNANDSVSKFVQYVNRHQKISDCHVSFQFCGCCCTSMHSSLFRHFIPTIPRAESPSRTAKTFLTRSGRDIRFPFHSMEASANIHSKNTDVTMEDVDMEEHRPSVDSNNASTGTQHRETLGENETGAIALPETPLPATPTTTPPTAVKSSRREPAFRRGKYKPRERKEWAWQFKPVKLLPKSDGSLEVVTGESRNFPKSRLDRTRVTRTRKRVDYLSRILANPIPWATEDMDIKPPAEISGMDPASPNDQTDTDVKPPRKRKRAESAKKTKSLPQTIAQLFHRPVPAKLESGHLQGLWHVGVPRMEFPYLQEAFPYDKYDEKHPEPLPRSLKHKSGFISRFGRPLVPEVELGEEWYSPQGQVDLKDHFSLEKLKDATGLTRTIKVETEGLRMDVYYQRGFELAAKRVLDRLRVEQTEQEEGAKEEEARLKAEAARAELRNNWQSSLLKGGADADAVLAGRQMTWFKDMAEGMSKEAAHKAAQAEAAVAEAEAVRAKRAAERAAQRRKLLAGQDSAAVPNTASSSPAPASGHQEQTPLSTSIPSDAPGTSAQHQRQQLELLLQQQQLLQQLEKQQQHDHRHQQQPQYQQQPQQHQYPQHQQLEELQRRLQDSRLSAPLSHSSVEVEKEAPSLADYYQANSFLASMFQLKGKYVNQLPVPLGPGASRILQTLLLGLETKILAMGCHLQRQELAQRLIVKAGDKTLVQKLVQQMVSRRRLPQQHTEGQNNPDYVFAHQLPLPSGARGSWMDLDMTDYERDPERINPLTRPVLNGPYFRLGKTETDSYILKTTGRDGTSSTRANTAQPSSPISSADTPVFTSSQEPSLDHSRPTVPTSAAFDSTGSQKKRGYRLPFVANPLEIPQSMDPFWMAREYQLHAQRRSLTQPLNAEGIDISAQSSSAVTLQVTVPAASASLTAPTTAKSPTTATSIPLMRPSPRAYEAHTPKSTPIVAIPAVVSPAVTPFTEMEAAAQDSSAKQKSKGGRRRKAPEELQAGLELESETATLPPTTGAAELPESGAKPRKKIGRPRKIHIDSPGTANPGSIVVLATKEGSSEQAESSTKNVRKPSKTRGPAKKRTTSVSEGEEPESLAPPFTSADLAVASLASDVPPAVAIGSTVAESTKKSPKRTLRKAGENDDNEEPHQEPGHAQLKRARLQ